MAKPSEVAKLFNDHHRAAAYIMEADRNADEARKSIGDQFAREIVRKAVAERETDGL